MRLRVMASLTIVAPGHEDIVKAAIWFVDPIFSTNERKNKPNEIHVHITARLNQQGQSRCLLMAKCNYNIFPFIKFDS